MCIHCIDKSAGNLRFVNTSYTHHMSKNKVLNIRIDADIKKQAKKLADRDGRSLSNWVTRLIQSEIKKAEKEKKS